MAQRSSLGSARLPQDAANVTAAWFASPKLLRLIAITAPPRELRLIEFDLDRRTLRQTGAISSRWPVLVRGNEDGSRLLVRDPNRRLLIIDGRTAAIEVTLDLPGWRDATFLPRGGLAVTRDSGPTSQLDIRDARGTLVRSIPLPVATTWAPRATNDGRVIVAVRDGGRWDTVIADPASGAVLRIPATALYESSWSRRDPRELPLDPPRYFMQNRRLVRWNYATQKSEDLFSPSS